MVRKRDGMPFLRVPNRVTEPVFPTQIFAQSHNFDFRRPGSHAFYHSESTLTPTTGLGQNRDLGEG